MVLKCQNLLRVNGFSKSGGGLGRKSVFRIKQESWFDVKIHWATNYTKCTNWLTKPGWRTTIYCSFLPDQKRTPPDRISRAGKKIKAGSKLLVFQERLFFSYFLPAQKVLQKGHHVIRIFWLVLYSCTNCFRSKNSAHDVDLPTHFAWLYQKLNLVDPQPHTPTVIPNPKDIREIKIDPRERRSPTIPLIIITRAKSAPPHTYQPVFSARLIHRKYYRPVYAFKHGSL